MTDARPRQNPRVPASGRAQRDSARLHSETTDFIHNVETTEIPRKVFPKVFGAYVLQKFLSRGGMAEIYRAEHTGPHDFRKTVVIKRILPELARNEDFRRLFVEEAKTMALLDHPNILPVHELGEVDGDLYMSLEYFDGFDLKALLQKAREKGLKLPLELSVYVASQLARALDFAFTREGPDGRALEIVHRDVSPPNILISFSGAVKLTDFGISRPSSYEDAGTDPPQGKLPYMSPEQVEGRRLDIRSDIFSLGVVLYEMIAGRRPFGESKDPVSGAARRSLEMVPLRSISARVTPRLEKVVTHALASSPEDRYQDAGRMAAALDRVIHERPAMGSPQLAQFMREVFDASSRETTPTA